MEDVTKGYVSAVVDMASDNKDLLRVAAAATRLVDLCRDVEAGRFPGSLYQRMQRTNEAIDEIAKAVDRLPADKLESLRKIRP